MKHYRLLSDLHRENGWEEPKNLMFSIVSCQAKCPLGHRTFTSDAYVVAYKKMKPGLSMYGQTSFDHTNGCIFFIKPGQLIELKHQEFEEQGFMLLIDRNYLFANCLCEYIDEYGYFNYHIHEALHLSPAEENIIWELYRKIDQEYHAHPDEHSREIILSHIASLLRYVQRFYKRQFIDRFQITSQTVYQFNLALAEQLKNLANLKNQEQLLKKIAATLGFSPAYLNDLLKQETGRTAIEMINNSSIGIS